MHGWWSESTDGPKGGWSCVFWSGCNGCSGRVTSQLPDVVWCSAVVVVVVVVVVGLMLCNVVVVVVVVVEV